MTMTTLLLRVRSKKMRVGLETKGAVGAEGERCSLCVAIRLAYASRRLVDEVLAGREPRDGGPAAQAARQKQTVWDMVDIYIYT